MQTIEMRNYRMRRMQEREDSNEMRRRNLKGEEGTKEEE